MTNVYEDLLYFKDKNGIVYWTQTGKKSEADGKIKTDNNEASIVLSTTGEKKKKLNTQHFYVNNKNATDYNDSEDDESSSDSESDIERTHSKYGC